MWVPARVAVRGQPERAKVPVVLHWGAEPQRREVAADERERSSETKSLSTPSSVNTSVAVTVLAPCVKRARVLFSVRLRAMARIS